MVSIVRTFFQPERVRKTLAKKNRFLSHVLAYLIGIIAPFFRCNAIPLFLGLVEAGVFLRIMFTLLTASPMINEVALIMLLGMFGLKIALIYIKSGLVIAVATGVIIGKLSPEKLIEDFVLNAKGAVTYSGAEMKFEDRIDYAKCYTLDTL